MYLQRNQPYLQNKVQLGDEAVFLRKVSGSQYVNPYAGQKVTSYYLVSLLSSLHCQKHLNLKNPFVAYLKDAEKLLNEVGSDKAVSLVLLSAKYARHPWSFKFVLRLAEDCVHPETEESLTTLELIKAVCDG